MSKRDVRIAGTNKRRSKTLRFLLLFVASLYFTGAGVSLAGAANAGTIDEQKLNAIAKEFQLRLGIPQPISISLVEVNKYLVSVQRSAPNSSGFTIQCEQKFLAQLTEEEVKAVIAHELGHVWIFTHHPFLQTEALANEQALLLVSRDVLEKVYEKVWQAEGHKGSLQDFLAKVE